MSTNPNLYKDAKAQAKAAKAYAKANRPWYSKKRFWALGVVLLALLAGIFGGGDDSSDPAADKAGAKVQTTAAAPATKAETTAPAVDKATEAAAPKIGETISYNTYDFTVNSVKCGVSTVGGEYFKETAQGQFCLVSLKVKNTGTKAQLFTSNEQKLLDAKGNEYSYSSEATVALMSQKGESDLWLKEINPGNSVTSQIVFDIPSDVEPTILHLSDGGLTDKGIDVALS